MPGRMTLLDRTVEAIRPLDGDAMAAAHIRQDGLVKPRGALGDLEQLGRQLAGLAGQCPPPVPKPAGLALFAGDHGVHAQGVSPWPQDITAAMVSTFLSGRAVVNTLARQAGVRVQVVDVGIATDLPPAPGLAQRRIRAGTHDLTTGPAMTRGEASQAIEVGIHTATDLVAEGCRCLLTGDMGIANTTPAAALIAAFTGAAPEDVTGRGTGIDDATWAVKVDVVRRALDRHRLDPADPLGVLAAVGGFEHAATVGFLLGAAAARVPVVLDGVVAGAAALAAAAFAPEVTGAFVAGHVSAEPGARLALSTLGLKAVLDLEMRLGEGSGAVLALPVVQASARVLHEVATLADLQGGADSVAPGIRRRILVLGGARSGKSATAERMVESAAAVTYVATGPAPSADDPEWRERVQLHRDRRPAHWTTVETRDLVGLLATRTNEPLVVDCLGTWLAATMDDHDMWRDDSADSDPDTAAAAADGAADMAADDAAAKVTAEVDALVEAWRSTSRTAVAISNEVGSGIVPATRSGRLFRDQLGLLNSRIAAESDEVWLVTAGIPQRLR
ncbi:nicotinate-nucleotide--dimethylbenzimidazole phosphoribosyltransferase [Actinopolymorpha sp. B9G3]|uniref:nicotinate-nucleotide--dimethylbenzimidazole phosphoribosyltransferase n=1 Tax=Actinopolymorpha sp. B9G3 TaxID=3158970 RepID=UPI0032D97369